jgi:hypothetical protein
VVFDKLLNSRAREPPFLLVLRDQSGQERTYVVFDKLLNSRAREPPFLLVLRDQSEFVPDEIFRIQ